MILAVDVFYFETTAKTVGILFKNWDDSKPFKIISCQVDNPLPYESGNFYKRELPCIIVLLQQLDLNEIDIIIVDGYVFLDENKKGGLGYHLYRSLNNKVPVIGVAKTFFKDNKTHVIEINRGTSKKPLFITSIGIDLWDAAEHIKKMHGEFRMPTLLKLLDMHTKMS